MDFEANQFGASAWCDGVPAHFSFCVCCLVFMGLLLALPVSTASIACLSLPFRCCVHYASELVVLFPVLVTLVLACLVSASAQRAVPAHERQGRASCAAQGELEQWPAAAAAGLRGEPALEQCQNSAPCGCVSLSLVPRCVLSLGWIVRSAVTAPVLPGSALVLVSAKFCNRFLSSARFCATQVRELGVVEATETRSAFRSWKLELTMPTHLVRIHRDF